MKSQILIISLFLLPFVDQGLLGQRPAIEGEVIVRSSAGSIEDQINDLANGTDGPFWIGYEVPISDEEFDACCERHRSGPCEINSHHGYMMGHFDEGDFSWSEGTQYVRILYLIDDSIRTIEIFSAGCPISSQSRKVYWLSGVDPAESVEFLDEVIRGSIRGISKGVREEAVTAMAMHAGPAAILRLEEIVRGDLPADIRDGAVFWLGAIGGSRGFEIVRDLVWNDPDRKIREKATFALAQSRETDAPAALIDVARRHKDTGTRAKALFWIGSSNVPGASELLKWVIDNDASEELRDKAVFGLSQLPDESSVPMLIELAKTHPRREVRRKSIFWLGQKAGKKSVEALRNAVDDPDDDLKQYAVFAIAQLPSDESVPLLLDLAERHSSPGVRKKAIFWLSQIDDDRAAEAIERILLK